MLSKVYHYLKNPRMGLARLMNCAIFRGCPDDIYLKMEYWLITGKKLDLASPKTYNEKLQWLKLFNRNPDYIQLVDKYEVRKFVSQRVGEAVLIPLLGVYEDFNSIVFDKLPPQFVLKCTHDSGGLVICKNKDDFNLQSARRKINRCLNKNYYHQHREWPYKNVVPRIICEKYMVDESGTELKDYKIFCFFGEPKLIQVDYNRFSGHKRNLYDTLWNYIPVSIQYPTDPNAPIAKPKRLDEMLNIARVLASDFPHVRIDLYNINETIYFGEMTFYHGAGYEKFQPELFERQMGEWIKLDTLHSV